jgi:hypothetical protein
MNALHLLALLLVFSGTFVALGFLFQGPPVPEPELTPRARNRAIRDELRLVP